MALAMTHEEVVTWLAAREIHSYKQLPADVVPHPDQGARRGAAQERHPAHARVHHEGRLQPRRRATRRCRRATGKHIGAYDRIYARCGVDCMMVEGDSGMMGGDDQPRVHGATPTPARTRSSSAASAATRPTSRLASPARPRAAGERADRAARDAPFRARARRSTCSPRRARHARLQDDRPGRRVPRRCRRAPSSRRSWSCRGRGAERRRLRPSWCCVRGDHELRRAQAAQGARRRVPPGDGRRGRSRPRASSPASSAPCRRTLPVFADEALRLGHYVAGANKAGYHRAGVTLEQVPQATFADLRDARPGDPCAQCARRPRGRARHRGRQHLPARHQVLGAHGGDVPGRGRQGARHRHGQLRHRPGAHRRGRRRAAPRRPRHLLAGEHRAVPGAPRAGARLRRRAARPGRRARTSQLGRSGFDVLYDDRD